MSAAAQNDCGGEPQIPYEDQRTRAEEITMMTDRVILISTIVITAVYFYATTLIPSLEIGDPLGPKAFPRLLGFAMLFAAGMLALEIWKKGKASAKQAADEAPFDLPVLAVIACVAVWTGLYYIAFQPLGYIAATAIYLLAMMAWFNRGKWVANVLTAVLFSIMSYVMFVKLDVNLPRGVEAISWVSDAVIAVTNFIINLFKSVFGTPK